MGTAAQKLLLLLLSDPASQLFVVNLNSDNYLS